MPRSSRSSSMQAAFTSYPQSRAGWWSASTGGEGGVRGDRREICHLAGDGPPLVVPPGAVDEQHGGRITLLAEPQPADQAKRGPVGRLNVGLEPVQPQLAERVPQRQAQ